MKHSFSIFFNILGYVVEYPKRHKKYIQFKLTTQINNLLKKQTLISHHIADVNNKWLLGSVGESNGKQLLLSVL